MTDETENTFVNQTDRNEPDESRGFVVSGDLGYSIPIMVANVPFETVCDDHGVYWCYGDIQYVNPNVYGVGSTEEEAVVSFFRAARDRYMALTVIHADARTADERREYKYFQRCRANADAESGRDGG